MKCKNLFFLSLTGIMSIILGCSTAQKRGVDLASKVIDNSSDTVWFSGGYGHLNVQISFRKTNKSFYYIGRDDLLVSLIEGSYEYKNDSVILYSDTIYGDFYNNEEKYKPYVIEEKNSEVKADRIALSTSNYESLDYPVYLERDSSKRTAVLKLFIKDVIDWKYDIKDYESNTFRIIVPEFIMNPDFYIFSRESFYYTNDTLMNDKIFLKKYPINYRTGSFPLD